MTRFVWFTMGKRGYNKSKENQPDPGGVEPRKFGDLPLAARAYILILIALAIFIAFFYLPKLEAKDLLLAIAMGVLSGALRLLRVKSNENDIILEISNVPLAIIFFAAGLPAAILAIFISSIIDYLAYRGKWHVPAFNFSGELFCFYLVSLEYNWTIHLSPHDPTFTILAMIVGSALYAFSNLAILYLIVWFADRRKVKKAGVFTPLSFMREFSLMSLGAAVVFVWRIEPLASILVLSPIYVQFASLNLPNLLKKVRDDPKTGVLNAEAFRQKLDDELSRANRFDRPLALVMCDMDRMRKINNTYGHLAGDQVLIAVSNILTSSFREVDTVARYGGEEFVIILPGAELDDAGEIAERARANIEGMCVEASHANCDIRVTMSFGIASKSSPQQTPEDLIHNADVALYYAKENGRNCIGVFRDASSIQLIVPSAFSYEQHEVKT